MNKVIGQKYITIVVSCVVGGGIKMHMAINLVLNYC